VPAPELTPAIEAALAAVFQEIRTNLELEIVADPRSGECDDHRHSWRLMIHACFADNLARPLSASDSAEMDQWAELTEALQLRFARDRNWERLGAIVDSASEQ